MNARQIELFRAILRDGSLTAAAGSLGVSQAVASKMLRHRKDHLGYALFERIGSRLITTPEAQLLRDDAVRVFRQIEVLRDLARSVGERRVGLLRIGASLPVIWSVLPPAPTDFRARHPTVKLHLHNLTEKEITEALRSGNLDLGPTLSPMLTPTVRTEALAPVQVSVLLPERHPLTSLAAIGRRTCWATRLFLTAVMPLSARRWMVRSGPPGCRARWPFRLQLRSRQRHWWRRGWGWGWWTG